MKRSKFMLKFLDRKYYNPPDIIPNLKKHNPIRPLIKREPFITR